MGAIMVNRYKGATKKELLIAHLMATGANQHGWWRDRDNFDRWITTAREEFLYLKDSWLINPLWPKKSAWESGEWMAQKRD